VELLVTVLLLSLVVGGLLPLLTSGDEAYQELRWRQGMVQNGRVALDKLLRETRSAEAFRAVAPGLVRLSTFWGDGTGADPTVEFVLNAGTGDLDYRWAADWDFRRQITVTAQDAVAVDYAVALTFNHAGLVAAGASLASGDDVRVRYWTGTQMVELDRFLDPTSAWNSATTRIWFRLQTALAANAANGNYYLYYGNLAAGPPPANGDNVFLDSEDGTTLGGWQRRDSGAGGCAGTHSPSAADGFIFQTNSGNNCYRQLSKNVPQDNVEIFWDFRSGAAGDAAANDRHMPGMGARFSNAGDGYIVSPGEDSNRRLRVRQMSGWTTIAQTWQTPRDVALYRVTSGTDYYGRFYLVGAEVRAKFWPAAGAEPAGWMLTGVDDSAPILFGPHYTQVDGHDSPQDHRHRRLIVRPRVANEPLTVLGVETTGTRPDVLESLAGPFRSMTLSCFNGAGTAIDCVPTTPVRSVQVALVVMDPTGRIPDITLTGRAFRQSP
jgi:hypothetical protein